MLGSLDPIIATLAVILGLSLIVQAIQQIFKQWLDLKSLYMKFQLLALFDNDQMKKKYTYHGLAPIGRLVKKVTGQASNVVAGIESALKSYGYSDLAALENLDSKRLQKIVKAIDWENIPGVKVVKSQVADISKDIDNWFDIAKNSFQDLYERRMKVWSFFVSLAVVVALNANLFSVYRQFSVNPELRNAAISWAQQFTAKERDTTTAQVSMTDEQIAKSIRAKVDSVRALLNTEGFQVIGWNENGPKEAWWAVIAGWLAMTLLVSLGAPFWYDLLKTVMGLKERLGKGGDSPKPAEHKA